MPKAGLISSNIVHETCSFKVLQEIDEDCFFTAGQDASDEESVEIIEEEEEESEFEDDMEVCSS